MLKLEFKESTAVLLILAALAIGVAVIGTNPLNPPSVLDNWARFALGGLGGVLLVVLFVLLRSSPKPSDLGHTNSEYDERFRKTQERIAKITPENTMALMRNWLQAIPLLAATLIVLPPVRALIEQQTGVTLTFLVVGLLVAVLLVAFTLLGSINKPTSIYKSTQVKARFMEVYDAKMKVGSGESRHMPAQRSRCGGMMDRPES